MLRSGSPSIPNATPDARILDSNGQDITSHISQGSLGGLLNVRNTVLPSLQGNGQQQGALNQLAQQVADRVNSILTSAQTAGGQPGTPLFTYSAASPPASRRRWPSIRISRPVLSRLRIRDLRPSRTALRCNWRDSAVRPTPPTKSRAKPFSNS